MGQTRIVDAYIDLARGGLAVIGGIITDFFSYVPITLDPSPTRRSATAFWFTPYGFCACVEDEGPSGRDEEQMVATAQVWPDANDGGGATSRIRACPA